MALFGMYGLSKGLSLEQNAEFFKNLLLALRENLIGGLMEELKPEVSKKKAAENSENSSNGCFLYVGLNKSLTKEFSAECPCTSEELSIDTLF